MGVGSRHVISSGKRCSGCFVLGLEMALWHGQDKERMTWPPLGLTKRRTYQGMQYWAWDDEKTLSSFCLGWPMKRRQERVVCKLCCYY